jgi:hypothetical protein
MAASIGSVGAASAGAQGLPHEFTEQELLKVFRWVASESDAQVMARAATRGRLPGEEVRPKEQDQRTQPHAGKGLAFQPEPTIDLTEDTLVLLSLLSEETARKVERYRRAGRGERDATPDEQRQWEQRRALLKAWVERGLSRGP